MHRWADAREAYERRQSEHGHSNNLELTLGRMRCQHALADWDGLCALAADEWESGRLQVSLPLPPLLLLLLPKVLLSPTQDADARAEVARLAAAGAWNLGQWDAFESYSKSLRKDTLETDFFCAVLDVNCGRAPVPAPASNMHSHPCLARLGEYLGEYPLPQPLRRGKSEDRRGEDEVGLGADCACGRELPPRVQGGGPGECCDILGEYIGENLGDV